MKKGPFIELSRRERRRLVMFSAIRTVVSIALLLGLYALVPVEPITTTEALTRLLGSLVLFALVIAWQIRTILSATYPLLRAIEAVIIAITVFTIFFALLYLGLSQADSATFSELLGRVSAFYFTVTVLATVSFGDISARSDVARVVVTIQMLLDLTFIAVIVRVFTSVARSSGSR
jgi:voltage-gated potassium channel